LAANSSLFGNSISLFCSEKFPVPLRREFCCKSLESRAIVVARAGQGATFNEIPCKFPC
jgi:hypothetical protein